MSRDALKELLKSADASAAAPPLANALPALVRRRHHERRRHCLVAAAAAVTLAPLLALALFLRSAAPPPPQIATSMSEPTVARHDLAQLDVQAALHEQTVTRLRAPRRSDVASAATAVVSGENPVIANVREQRDRAALVIVYQAEQAIRDQRPDRALAAYRRAIELFPTSHWADVARRRLKEMST